MFIDVFPITVYMDEPILEAARKIGKDRNIPVEVKKIGNSHYLYRSTTKWDKEKKKRVKVSEYLGRINGNGLVEKNNRSIFEFGNSELLMTLAWDLVPELKRRFPDHWKEIVAISVVRVMDNQPLRLVKSRWEKLYASRQIDASLSPNTLSEKIRIIGSDHDAQYRFFRSLINRDDFLLFDLSSIFSRSQNINLAEKGYNHEHRYIDEIGFALIFSGKRHMPVIMEPIPGSVRDMKAYDSVVDQYDLKNCVIVADRGLASYDMPKRKGISYIVAIKRNFKIIDYSMKLGRSFIYRDRGINSGKKQIEGKFLYMYEDTMMRADEETSLIKKIGEGTKTQKDLEEERPELGKFSILSNMDSDPESIYGMYKMREEVEQAFDAMKNELENDKAYLHTTEGIRGYFFLSFISLYIYFRILETLKAKGMSPKISVKEAILELSKIYAMVHGARVSLAEIPDKSQKMADLFGLKLSPKILRN